MLCKKLLLLITIPCAVLCWKPIVGPNAFSTKQSHPAKSSEITEDTAASGTHSITYHGNAFLDENAPSHAQLIFTEPFESDKGKSDLLESKLFGSTYYGGGSVSIQIRVDCLQIATLISFSLSTLNMFQNLVKLYLFGML